MSNKIKRIGAVLMAAALVVSGLFIPGQKGKAPVTEAAVTGTFDNLNQAQITAAMGAGWNCGNQLEANSGGVPDETAWQSSKITKKLLTKVKESGFTTVRIPVSYLSKIGAAPDYTVEKEWLDRVQQVVDWCMELELYAIINVHGDGYNSIDGGWLLCNAPEKEQPAIREKYAALWKQIATRFKDYDEHLIFEAMNEEFDGTYPAAPNTDYYENINKYNQVFLDAVRQTGGNNDKRWVMITGWNTNIEFTAGKKNEDGTYTEYGFKFPTDNYLSKDIAAGEKRVMISVHSYDPWSFGGEEYSTSATRWGVDANSKWSVSYQQEDYVEQQHKLLNERFVSQGYPVVLGEYGSNDKTSLDSYNALYRPYYANTVCYYAKQNGIVPVIWDNGYNGNYGFALYDRTSATDEDTNEIVVTHQEIIDGIMDVYQRDTKMNPPEIDPKEDYFKGKVNMYYATSKKANTVKVEFYSQRGVDGYQFYASTSKNFKKNLVKIKDSNWALEAKTLKNLKGGKKYYVKMRAYTKVGNKTYYSKWSKIKSVKAAK